MKQEDLQNAVQNIQASAQLREKVLSGKPSESNGGWGYLRYATYAATALLFVVCLLFLAKTINTAVPTNLPTSKPVASQQNSIPSGLNSDNKVQNILLIGVNRNSKGVVERSDCTMILTIDSRSSNQRLILAPFHSGLYVDIPGHGKNRLNAAYALGGATLDEETIEKNFKLDIDYYVDIDFSSLIKIVDRIGGIRVDITEEEAKRINQSSGEPKTQLTAGSCVLTGKQALYYSRMRSINSELELLEREQNVAAGIIDRFKEKDSASQKEMILDVLPWITTNMDKNLIMNAPTYCNYPVSYFLPGEDLFQAKQVAIQDGTMTVLLPDLDKYSAKLYRFIYQNNVS